MVVLFKRFCTKRRAWLQRRKVSNKIGHHLALAGGASISQLQKVKQSFRTPPGFSRWYFTFTATKGETQLRGHRPALAGGVREDL